LKTVTLEKLMATFPERVIEHAVKGMLPKNHLNAKMMKRLRVYKGEALKPVAKAKMDKPVKAKPEAEPKN
jgi:large subunit ribosomal protein L13